MTESVINKKKKVSKRNKKSWIKHIDNKDVEEFLDLKRQEERLGGPFKNKKDEELFVLDDAGAATNEERRLTRKERARLPLKCYSDLRNDCKIPDPIAKRNTVKTAEERKCRIRKSIEAAKAVKGVIKQKIIISINDRRLTNRKKKLKPTETTFEKDIWNTDKEMGMFNGHADTSWLNTTTVRHHMGTISVCIPKDMPKKKSVIPAIEPPHPGTSYNPTLKDHRSLLKDVVDKEMVVLKEEAHIERVTSAIFRKIPPEEKQAQWVEEMMQGLVKDETEQNEEVPMTSLSVNPPTSFSNKKTLKQRRKIKELKAAALARQYAKVEKKKMSDIYKLKFIKNDIEEIEKDEEKNAEIKEEKAKIKSTQTKRIAPKKYVEPDLVYNRKDEITGNLRNIKKSGSLLADRFYSLQKRNIIPPSNKVTRFRRAKVKKFTKASHKPEGVTATRLIRKLRKGKK